MHCIFKDLPCLSLPILCIDVSRKNLCLLLLLTTPRMRDITELVIQIVTAAYILSIYLDLFGFI
jgi:hypothetical protein